RLLMNFKKIFPVIIVGLIIIVGVIFMRPYDVETSSSHLKSPLPQLFTNTKSKVLAYHEFWEPVMGNPVISKAKRPELTALSVLAYDTTTDQVLYEKESKKRMPIASITKIMTANIIIENEGLDQRVSVSKRAATIGENSMMVQE